jgi:hypothetical protein
MKHLRYFSEFYDAVNALYRVEILQKAEQPFSPREVALAAEPLTIDWNSSDKLDPVMSSSATLRLVSMSDRQFVDMYSVEPCAIQMNVYRNGELYWSGTLDTELFEEPYSQADRYITECTFSDLAVLNRLAWQLTGKGTLREVIEQCLAASEITYLDLTPYISTTIPNVAGSILDNCVLSYGNFYDEDGTAWNVREVLDEVLRPFALRLTQRAGRIFVYDINSVASQSPKTVKWLFADAKLGVEPTYNKATLTFSPYSDATVYDGSLDSESVSLNAGDSGQIAVPMPETEFNGFNFYYGAPIGDLTLVQNLYVGGTARLFRIKPDNDGQESVGVMWGVRPLSSSWTGNAPTAQSWPPAGYTAIMESPKIPIVAGSNDYRLKVSLDVLFDVRKNPFEEASVDNEKGNWEDFNDWANYGLIVCQLVLYGFNGKIYKYANYKNDSPYMGAGYWYEVTEDSNTWMVLEYYDEGNRESSTGFGGWQTNKQSSAIIEIDLPKSLTFNIGGEKLPLPPVSGELVFKVYPDIITLDNGDDLFVSNTSKVANISRWLLYKDPKITIAQVSGKDIDPEDVQISAWINKLAEEEITVDTYLGCATDRTPLSKGAILSPTDFTPIRRFTRAGVTDRLENLLIGTIYSQYADRKSTLSGTIRLIPDFGILYDNNSVNSVYLLLSESQNVAEATSEIKMAEIAADNYENIEYEAI